MNAQHTKTDITVWVAMPTDGKRATLALALASLLQQRHALAGVLLYENGRDFGAERPEVMQLIKLLRARGVRVAVRYTCLPQEGFTRLRHEMLLECQHLGASHVLLMDDDALLDPDALGLLAGLAATQPSLGWASPLLLYPESYECRWGEEIDPQWQLILRHWTPKDGPEVLCNACHMAATTCLFIHLKRAMELGGFDFHAHLPDFAEDRFFTARFFGRFDTFVHRGARCHITSGMSNEGKRWRMPVNKLLLQEGLAVQLDPAVLARLRA